MDILGHRGSRRPGPENTITAVDRALSGGADGVEVDVRRTADGQLVCSHDPAVGGLVVVRTPAADLVAAGAPLLTDVLDAVAGRGDLIVEVKNQPGEPDFDAPAEATAHLLVQLLRGRDLRRLRVSSFNWFAIEAVRAADPSITTGFLTAPGVAVQAGVAYAQEAGHPEIHAHIGVVLDVPGAVEFVHDAGLRLVVWTVETSGEARRLRDLAVDGIICDDPVAVSLDLRMDS